MSVYEDLFRSLEQPQRTSHQFISCPLFNADSSGRIVWSCPWQSGRGSHRGLHTHLRRHLPECGEKQLYSWNLGRKPESLTGMTDPSAGRRAINISLHGYQTWMWPSLWGQPLFSSWKAGLNTNTHHSILLRKGHFTIHCGEEGKKLSITHRHSQKHHHSFHEDPQAPLPMLTTSASPSSSCSASLAASSCQALLPCLGRSHVATLPSPSRPLIRLLESGPYLFCVRFARRACWQCHPGPQRAGNWGRRGQKSASLASSWAILRCTEVWGQVWSLPLGPSVGSWYLEPGSRTGASCT